MEQGEALGPYRLIQRLGRGGFAEVWEGHLDPALLRGLSPQGIGPALKALAAMLGKEHPALAGLTSNLLEGHDLLSSVGEGGLPLEVRERQREVIDDVLSWLEGRGVFEEGLSLALKVPFHDGYVRQLRREKDVLKGISHPNLVQQYALDLIHEPPYLAMERIEGWSLRDALKTEPIPPMRKVLAVMDQLLAVLHVLHRRGIAHGDVKPENIVMQPDGTLRLIDLGLGRVSQAVLRDAYLSLSLASRVPLQGTLSYMAPEVRRGEEAGPAADLYSAGIVLYEMLVGDVPTGMALPSEAAQERQLTERFDVLLKWVLHPEPARRIPSADDFRERVLITLRPRRRSQLGTGVRQGRGREGTTDFDQWALAEASPFVQGDWVGECQLLEPVGRGGFGEVWLAEAGPESQARKDGHKEVALKIAIGPHGKEALAKEADVGGRLDHPLIPSVIQQALEHDPPYLVVDFVRGGSLRALLNEHGPVDPADAVPLLESLVGALAHCHQRGVLHQDLKPENLLCDPEKNELYLLDFGLASTGDPVPEKTVEVSKHLKTEDAAGGGTFEYMAPERRQGGESTHAADVYSLGVVLYEMLTGQLPRGLTRLRELCPAAPQALEALTQRLLSADPSKRPSLAEVAAKLASDRPRRRIFGGRGRRAAEDELWPFAAGAGLPGLLGVAAGLLELPRVGAGLCGVSVLAATVFLASKHVRTRWTGEQRTAYLVVPLLACLVAAGLLRPLLPGVVSRGEVLQQRAQALEDELRGVDYTGGVVELERRRAELHTRLGELRAELAKASPDGAGLERVEQLEQRLERFGAWSRARDEAAGEASRGLTARAHLQDLLVGRRLDPAVNPAAWGKWEARRKGYLEEAISGLTHAIQGDPLHPEAVTWRRELVRLRGQLDAWPQEAWEAGSRAVGPLAKGEETAEPLLAELERLFPEERRLTALYGLEPRRTEEGLGLRGQLAEALALEGRRAAAEQVLLRLEADAQGAVVAKRARQRVAHLWASQDAARRRWHQAPEGEGPDAALERLRGALAHLPFEEGLADSVERLSAQVLGSSGLRRLSDARTRLWRLRTPDVALAGWVDGQVATHEASPGTLRLAVVVWALMDDVDRLNQHLPAIGGQEERFVQALAALGRQRERLQEQERALEQIEAQVAGDGRPAGRPSEQESVAYAEWRAAHLDLERAGVDLREALATQ